MLAIGIIWLGIFFNWNAFNWRVGSNLQFFALKKRVGNYLKRKEITSTLNLNESDECISIHWYHYLDNR